MTDNNEAERETDEQQTEQTIDLRAAATISRAIASVGGDVVNFDTKRVGSSSPLAAALGVKRTQYVFTVEALDVDPIDDVDSRETIEVQGVDETDTESRSIEAVDGGEGDE